MVGVAENAASGTVGSDVPGIVIDDGAYRAGGPIHRTERARPDGEHQIAGASEEGFVHDELVIAMLVEALQARAVAAHAVHARSGIAGERNPCRFQRVELRVDDGAREWDDGGTRAIEAGHDQAAS